jgi:hypothetical protein
MVSSNELDGKDYDRIRSAAAAAYAAVARQIKS